MKPLKDLTQYHYSVMQAFYKFLQYENEEELLTALYSVQRHHRSWNRITKTDKSMWFRFYTDDTLATTINDIVNDLHGSNRDFRMEAMKICCDTAQIEVYYS